MGEDKATVLIDGVCMAARVADVMADAGLEPWIVRRQDSPPATFVGASGRSYPVCIEDHDRPRHALWGIVTALEHAEGEPVLVLPCDVPDLTPTELELLLAVVVPSVAWDGQRVHGLCAVVPAEALKRAREFARNGGSVRAFVADFERVAVDGRRLRNANEPGDL